MNDAEKMTKKTGLARYRRLLMVGVPLLALLVGTGIYLETGRYVSTDDAYIKAATVSVSTNISAQVGSVAVHDNQIVHQGDLLFHLDDRSFVIAEQEAEAKLTSARLQVAGMKASYRQRLADYKSAQDQLRFQEREYNRQKALLASGIGSQSQFDKAKEAFQAAQQGVVSNGQNVANSLANLGGEDIDIDNHPSVRAAQAALDKARLNVSYANVRAPITGIVTKVEDLQPGNYVTAGTPVFSLVSTTDVWVEANFKETDLDHMRVGQKATVSVDAYPDAPITGHVASVSPGTGSTFSLLPPENATGNWVKVVQRLPVRITIDAKDLTKLQSGLSVTADVDTEHRRSLFGESYAASLK